MMPLIIYVPVVGLLYKYIHMKSKVNILPCVYNMPIYKKLHLTSRFFLMFFMILLKGCDLLTFTGFVHKNRNKRLLAFVLLIFWMFQLIALAGSVS